MQESAITLHVYELQPDPSQQTQQPSATDRALLMVSGFLPAIGMGAYHTSLEVKVMNLKYTFAAGGGIMVGRSTGPDVGVPNGAKYSTSICLGNSNKTREELLEIVRRLGTLFFTPHSYNLVHRNCNHFAETLATALLSPQKRLESFPKWLNRLANTGAMVMANSNDQIASCNILEEAQLAAGY